MTMTKDECRKALRNDEPVTSLATLIEVALEDAAGLDREKYFPSYAHYHSPVGNRCAVCDAGAVMAGTLGSDPLYRAFPGDFIGGDAPGERLALDEFDDDLNPLRPIPPIGTHTAAALKALDLARVGHVLSAYLMLPWIKPPMPNGVLRVEISLHSEYRGWDEFERHLVAMKVLALQLHELEAGPPPATVAWDPSSPLKATT